MFETTEHDFGSVARGATAEYRVRALKSVHGKRAYRRRELQLRCTTPSVARPKNSHLEKGAILAHFNTDRFLGQRAPP